MAVSSIAVSKGRCGVIGPASRRLDRRAGRQCILAISISPHGGVATCGPLRSRLFITATQPQPPNAITRAHPRSPHPQVPGHRRPGRHGDFAARVPHAAAVQGQGQGPAHPRRPRGAWWRGRRGGGKGEAGDGVGRTYGTLDDRLACTRALLPCVSSTCVMRGSCGHGRPACRLLRLMQQSWVPTQQTSLTAHLTPLRPSTHTADGRGHCGGGGGGRGRLAQVRAAIPLHPSPVSSAGTPLPSHPLLHA